MNKIIRKIFFSEGRTEPSSENDIISELEQNFNCPQREKCSRVTTFRKKNKALISTLELALESLDQHTSNLDQLIEKKHCYLAGQHGKPFHQKIQEFSRQSLKTELQLEISSLDTELTGDGKGKMKSQKMASYIRKLKLLQEKKRKYLKLLREEEQEIAKFFV